MRLLPLQTLLMPVSPAKEIKLNDFVPATEETQIACQQARHTIPPPPPPFCLSLSVTQPTFSVMLHRSSASGCRLCSAPCTGSCAACTVYNCRNLLCFQSAAHRLKSLRTVRQEHVPPSLCHSIRLLNFPHPRLSATAVMPYFSSGGWVGGGSATM